MARGKVPVVKRIENRQRGSRADGIVARLCLAGSAAAAALAGAALLAVAAEAVAQERPAADGTVPDAASGFAAGGGAGAAFEMGPLSPYLEAGGDEVWTLGNDGGAAVLENGVDPYSISYYYAGAAPGTEGSREIGVDVAVLGSTEGSLAGLLYGFRESPRAYLAFTVGGDRSVNVHELRDGRFEERMKTAMPELRAERTALAIRESGGGITLLANGVEVGSFADDLTGRGAVGILAAGVGAHRFSDFAVTGAGPSAGAAPDGAPRTGFAGSSAGEPVGAAPDGVAPPRTDGVAAPPPGDLVYRDVRDERRGMVASSVPYPRDWTVDEGPDGVFATGPGGVRVLSTRPSPAHMDASDPRALEAARHFGMTVAPVPSPERYVRETLAAELSGRGYTLLDTAPFPAGADLYRRMTEGTRTGTFEFRSIGSDWRLADGTMAFLSVTLGVDRRGAFATWIATITEVQAPAERFEAAKAVFRHATEHARFAPAWRQAEAADQERSRQRNDAYWAELNARARAAHRQRMDAIEATGASASRNAKIYGDVLDISHQGYLKRSDMVDAGQSRAVDAIAGANVVTNPGTGERYRVEAGSNHYWVSDDGYYLGTDDALLDPRLDPRTSDRGWTPFAIER